MKLLVIGTIFALTQSAYCGDAYSIGLSFQYNKGYPYGYYPMGGANYGMINQCIQSPYMMSAANASYGPGYGYGPGAGGYGPGYGYGARPMPPISLPPHMAPPTPFMLAPPPMPPMGMAHGGPCGACMPPPPPCAMGCGQGPMMYGNAGGAYGGNGIYNAGGGVVVIDDRGIQEWEKNDTAAIVAATGGTLNGLASNVVPYAPYRFDPTINPLWYSGGPRDYTITPRPDAH
jgi:hypothetical protein